MKSNTVLIVENDPSYSERLKGLFASHGVDVRTVEDSRASLNLLDTFRPDLIVLSAELPTLSGYTVCRKLKRNPRFKDIPLLLISAQATAETFTQHKKLKTRAEGYFIKPFDMEALWQCALSHLEHRAVPDGDIDAVPLARSSDGDGAPESGLAISTNNRGAPPSSTSWKVAKSGWVRTRPSTDETVIDAERIQRALEHTEGELTKVKAELTESKNEIVALKGTLAERDAEISAHQARIADLEGAEKDLQELRADYESLEDLYIDQLEGSS